MLQDLSIRTHKVTKARRPGLIAIEKEVGKRQIINFAVPIEEKVNVRGIEKNSKVPGHSH